MGALQPGLPNPAMLPAEWHLLIIDLKDSDRLVAFTRKAPLSPHCQARETHAIFHQNTKGLHRAYSIPLEEARAIVKAYPICSHHNQGIGLGVGV
ncbi:POK8 protein, partial [Nyctibius bracteatus]|nr:POK8 protein [Nyctibius bracteatus]